MTTGDPMMGLVGHSGGRRTGLSRWDFQGQKSSAAVAVDSSDHTGSHVSAAFTLVLLSGRQMWILQLHSYARHF